MSAGSGCCSGIHKRSLAELLANRPKKADRKAESSNKSLQEAALYLLSCRQDVNQFLLEVEALPCKKVRSDDSSASVPVQEATPFTHTFVVSALRDQALFLNLPPNVLGAKAATSNIQKICNHVGSGAEETLLSRDQRDRLTDFLQTLKGLQAENCFSHSVFLKQIWEQERLPAVEVVWHLQNSDIVGLEDVLESCRDPHSAVDWFCGELHSLFLHMEKSLDVEFCEQMISGFLVVLIGKAFCKSSASGKKSDCSQSTKISLSILDKMLSWFLDRIPEAHNDEFYKPGVEQFWLIAYDASRYRVRVILEILEDFFTHTLSQTLVFRPKLKVSDAIRLQGGWSFAKTWPLLTTLYRKLFVLLNAEKLLSRIQRVLDTQEVNWHHVLACVSCLVVCQPEAQPLVKDLLSRLLSQAFETYELEYLITAFLVARQAALEGPAAFMSYTEWFRVTFGTPSSHQSITKKSLLFLLKFLSDLVPYETSQYLKVHILHPPFVAAKLRPLLMEYITLAKTRLADMKVSIEDMGLYEDLSVASDKHQTQPQAQQDVEKAVQIFQNTGKIPASVMEASIFRRPYFTSRFLPALLTPRPLPEAADSLMLLIDALRRSDKIPAVVMSSYLDACELEKHRKLEGNEKMEVSLNEEPMARLQASLCELRPFIADPKRHDEISCQVAMVADRLASALGSTNMDPVPAMSQPLFTESVEDLEPQELKVADLVITCFCQCVMAASSANPPDRQGPWPSLYVKMLCGHPRALAAVLSRILHLLCQQAGLLTDPHVVGLAVFSVHLHECRASLVSPNIEVNALEKFWELALKPQCMESTSVILRFCTAAVSYTCCRFSLLSPGVSLDCIPPLFMRKLQHLLPRLIVEAREEGLMEEDKEETPILCRSMLFPSAGWKEAAVRLWHQSHFQKLLTEQIFQLSFRDWLQWEMELGSDKDPVCDTDRHEYQRWALNCRFLPESSTKDGCGNDLEFACSIMVEALLEFGCSSGQEPSHTRTGMADILCRLQELVCDLLTQSRLGNLRQTNFLFNIFNRRLEVSSGSRTSTQLRRREDLATCSWILLGLPPVFLIGTSSERGKTHLDCEDLFRFIDKELKNIGQRGCALPYDIIAHFFRGLLGASAKCEDPSNAVDCILHAAHAQCPIILTSAALWWPRLGPAIESQWSCLHGGDLPKQIEVLREIQSDVDRCLAHCTSLPLTNTAWLSAAVLHFTMRRKKMAHEEILQLLGRKHVQMLDSLLFFSVLDLIPVLLEEGERPKKAQENCLSTIRCLEANGGSWVTAFQPTKEKHVTLLQQTAPDALRELLPLAFFSLAPCLPMERTVLQQDFVCVTLELYGRFLQLYVDGNPVLGQADTNEVVSRGRHFLLNCVRKCPSLSSVVRSSLPQIADSWEEKDPELTALLRNILQPCQDEDMFDQPDLF
ncbi:Fanconi anemia group A protein-like [Dendrobates tinctorius]|uniref:Fanconi anemia group A protein-like n=1 Tax=Dendrobates tinctorius TaxID=92724 RepID=UPI003CC9AE68